MLTRTIYKNIEDEDRTVELKIKEFSYWICVNLLKDWFLEKMMPLMQTEDDLTVIELIQKFILTSEQNVVEEFTKAFLERTQYRIDGKGEWLSLSEEEELDIETALVAIKEVGEANLKTFSRAATVMGYGDLVANLKDKMTQMTEENLNQQDHTPSVEEPSE